MQIALLPVAVALLVVLAICIWFFRHPIRVTVWVRRKRLQRAGFANTTVQTSFGSQSRGMVAAVHYWFSCMELETRLEHGTGSHRNWPRSIRWLCPIWLDTARAHPRRGR